MPPAPLPPSSPGQACFTRGHSHNCFCLDFRKQKPKANKEKGENKVGLAKLERRFHRTVQDQAGRAGRGLAWTVTYPEAVAMRLARRRHADRGADSRSGEARPATGGHTSNDTGTTAVSGPRTVFSERGAGAVGFPRGKNTSPGKALASYKDGSV